MYHFEVWSFFAQKQCFQQGAQCGNFTYVHLANCLGAILQHKPKTLLYILLKQLQQVCPHWVWKLKTHRK